MGFPIQNIKQTYSERHSASSVSLDTDNQQVMFNSFTAQALNISKSRPKENKRATAHFYDYKHLLSQSTMPKAAAASQNITVWLHSATASSESRVAARGRGIQYSSLSLSTLQGWNCSTKPGLWVKHRHENKQTELALRLRDKLHTQEIPLLRQVFLIQMDKNKYRNKLSHPSCHTRPYMQTASGLST